MPLSWSFAMLVSLTEVTASLKSHCFIYLKESIAIKSLHPRLSRIANAAMTSVLKALDDYIGQPPV